MSQPKKNSDSQTHHVHCGLGALLTVLHTLTHLSLTVTPWGRFVWQMRKPSQRERSCLPGGRSASNRWKWKLSPEPVFFRIGGPSGTWRSHQGPAERSAADQSAPWIRFLPAGAGCFREGTAALLYDPRLPGGLASSSCQNKPSRKKTNKQLMTFSRKGPAASPAGGETNAAEAHVSPVMYLSSVPASPD
uniref:Uncharacterized protein n=1 Tax=Molossus molossus TaxID=27622 RepID=A0A7J8CS45_MOLMO|nr:hypothetical protein HJG59_009792 [Molossus molossus]